jgi:ABC-type lipoprotein release transport system permease subunit
MNDNWPVSPTLLVWLGAFFGLMVLLFMTGKVPISYNLRNLAVRWKTTLATALSFTLVVALLTVMLAFVNGMDQMTKSSGIDENVIALADGSTDESYSSLSADYGVRVLPEDIKKDIVQDRPGHYLSSREVYVVVNQPIEGAKEGGRRRRFIQMRGVEEPEVAAQVHKIELFPGGKWFPHGGFQKQSRQINGETVTETLYEIVIGEGVAKDMGPDKGKDSLEVGDVIDIGPVKWVVTGVMKSFGTTFGSEVWARSTSVGEYFGKKNTFSSITSRIRDEATPQDVANKIKNHKEGAATAQPEKEYYSKLTETNKQFLVAVIIIAVVMAIGGMLGVMNTMFAVISQRTKDIGVLRILGYSRRQVLSSFMLEAMLIGLLGGILGCGLGYLTDGATASSTLSSGPGGGGKSVVLRLVYDANTLGAGLLFTLIMGALGGLVPSLSAMRLRPLESVR